MPGRRRPGGYPERKVANLSWTGLEIDATIIAATAKVLLGSFVLSGDFDETVTRSRGAMMVRSDQSAASETQIGAMGMIVVSDDAFAAGITALPGPATDVGNDVPLFEVVIQ